MVTPFVYGIDLEIAYKCFKAILAGTVIAGLSLLFFVSIFLFEELFFVSIRGIKKPFKLL